jgi:hypothetical protein
MKTAHPTPAATAVEPVPHVKTPTVITEPKKKSAPTGLIVLFSALLLASGFFTLVTTSGKNKTKEPRDESSTIISIKNTELPAQFDTTVTLKKGEMNPIIKVPVWYNYEISNPGKPFGHRVENHVKLDTMGGSYPYIRPSEHVRFFELSALDEEVSVTIYFSRK